MELYVEFDLSTDRQALEEHLLGIVDQYKKDRNAHQVAVDQDALVISRRRESLIRFYGQVLEDWNFVKSQQSRLSRKRMNMEEPYIRGDDIRSYIHISYPYTKELRKHLDDFGGELVWQPASSNDAYVNISKQGLILSQSPDLRNRDQAQFILDNLTSMSNLCIVIPQKVVDTLKIPYQMTQIRQAIIKK